MVDKGGAIKAHYLATHQSEICKIEAVLYCNDGDWTESCTVLIEDQDGWLELLYWSEARQSDRNDDEDDNSQTPIMVLPKVS